MKNLFFILISLVLFAHSAYSQSLAARQPSSRQLKQMTATVQAFLDALPDSLRTKAMYAFDDEERFNWYFVPPARKGACYKSMNEPQRKAAKAMMQMALSDKG